MKIFNSIKKYWSIYLLALFYIVVFSVPQLRKEMFESSGGEFNNSSVMMLLSWLIGFASIIVLASFYAESNVSQTRRTLFSLGFTLVQVYLLYAYIGKLCHYPLGILNPFAFAASFIPFLFLIKGQKHFNLYIILFLAFPMYMVVYDKIAVYKFLSTCEANTPDTVYNPIYLPYEFFHEEIVDGEKRMMPNVIDIDGNPRGNVVFLDKEYYDSRSEYIYIYWSCGIFKKDIGDKQEYIDRFFKSLKHLINNNNIIMCSKSDISANTYQYFVVNLDEDNKPTYSEVFKSVSDDYHGDYSITYQLIKGAYTGCRYHKRPKGYSNPSNFIKPLSEKTVSQQGE